MFFPNLDTPATDGSWLSDDPQYQVWVEKLSSSDPRLRRRNPKGVLRRIPWPTPFTRMVVFEANSAVKTTWQQTTFKDPAMFRESLSTPTDPNARRILLLEGQTPSYIGILGIHFGIHPTFFVDHERESIPEAFQTDGELEIIPLPSTLNEHVSMKYYELLYLPPETRGFRLFCAETGRGLSTTRILGEFSDTGALHRRCSVWKRARAGGKGWDCKSQH